MIKLYYTMAQPSESRAFACRVLGCAAQDILLHENGKPYLANGPHFSISHSGGMLLLAVCESSPVGCDVEPANRVVKNETSIRTKLFPGNDDTPFLQLWTAYEARLKSSWGEAANVIHPDIHENFICAVAAHEGASIAQVSHLD